MKSLVKSFPKDNLTKSEREALNNLQQRDNTIITKANKGDDEQSYIIKNGNIAPTWQDSNTGLSSTTKNSGRSAISSVDCHTSRMSEFVDHYLQPAVTNF